MAANLKFFYKYALKLASLNSFGSRNSFEYEVSRAYFNTHKKIIIGSHFVWKGSMDQELALLSLELMSAGSLDSMTH